MIPAALNTVAAGIDVSSITFLRPMGMFNFWRLNELVRQHAQICYFYSNV